MSFYLSFTQNIRRRKVPHVFYFKDTVLYTLSGKSEVELANLSGNSENPVLSVLNYIKFNNIYDLEILLPLINEELLDEACDVISKYLLENDDSIGILTNNPNFREDYSWILDKYGITYSIPREKPTRGVPGVARKAKPRKKPEYAEACAIETKGSFKVCAPRRPEPEDVADENGRTDFQEKERGLERRPRKSDKSFGICV